MKREINVTLTDATGKQLVFETLSQFQDFCSNEHKYWIDANASLPDNITLNQTYTKANHLQAILNTFDSWKETEPTWDENTFTSSFSAT